MRRFAQVLVASLVISTLSSGAFAQGPSTKPSKAAVAMAEALFNDANVAAAKGDFETACAKFKESQALDPSIGTQYNIGLCEEKRGKLLAALAIFEELSRTIPDTDERKEQAEGKAAEIADKLAELTISLADDAPALTTVTRNGKPIPREELGSPVRVDPGKVEVVASAEGRASKTFAIDLKEGEKRALVVGPEPAKVTEKRGAGDVPPPAQPGGSTQKTIGFVVAGVGVVGLGVGAVTGVMVLGKKSTVETECPNQVCRSQEGLDAASSGRMLSLVSTIAFGVGVAGAGLGTALILTAKPPSKAAASGKPARGVYVGARPLLHGGYLSVGGPF